MQIKIEIPDAVNKIMNRLELKGFQSYIVGGCVRDALLGIQPNDWDLCTSATPSQITDCFSDYNVIETGIKHGTVTIIIDYLQYEVTTFRIDGDYSDYRHPDKVSFTTNLKSDLSRRDFTINAMAYNNNNGLIDYFSGTDDLSKGIIRCVGDPEKRFKEDALRIIRALRFASCYDFKLDTDTEKSANDCRNLLVFVAAERINTELNKLILGKGVLEILIKYTGILSVILPEISAMVGFIQNNPWHCFDVWEHTANTVNNADTKLIVRLCMLFHDSGKPKSYTEDEKGIGHFYGHASISEKTAFNRMKALKYDNKTIEKVCELIIYHDDKIKSDRKTIRKWLNKIGEDSLRDLIKVKKADRSAQNPEMVKTESDLSETLNLIDAVIKEKLCFSLRDLDINGDDIIKAKLAQGKNIGVILNILLELVIEEQIQNKKEILLSKAAEIAKNLESSTT